MSVGYVIVQWNRHKRIYDTAVLAFVVLYLAVFIITGKLIYRPPGNISDEILAMRALGSCAFIMLHVVLCIGPLTRLCPKVKPLLYNRRHLGVATFLVALAHGALALGYYHGFGRVNPFVSLLTSNTNFTTVSAFPFQILGAIALVILFLMAATSHDFWLNNLSPQAWKALHMLVYPAYALLVLHVTLGALYAQRHWLLATLVVAGATLVAGLHVCCGVRERARDRDGLPVPARAPGSWLEVCDLHEVPKDRGRVVCLAGRERVAVFRYDGGISAVTNVCRHQGGPLGEGKIIDGCITCPWHGWQYRPAEGQAPPPFTEKIATYRTRVVGTRVQIDPNALPPGTYVEPARVSEPPHE